jgi:hypothetical protein
MRPETPNLAQWTFRHHADNEAWSWQRCDVQGKVIERASNFPTFGKAITDAIKKGFLPNEHQWKVLTRYTEQSFPGSTPPTLESRLPHINFGSPRSSRDSAK